MIGPLVRFRRQAPAAVEETPEFIKRLNAVVSRARTVSIDEHRNATACGPDGPLWDDDVRALVLFNDKRMLEAA